MLEPLKVALALSLLGTHMQKLYDNSTTVEDEAAILHAFQTNSLSTYANFPHHKNISYGDHPRHTLDYFTLDKPDGTIIFIHGGYWQWCEKSDFAFLAKACLKHNYQCILVEYPLAPEQSMAQIISSIHRALSLIENNFGLTHNVMAVGHSAGAHLLANFLNTNFIQHYYLLSGIYDLHPIQRTHLNTALQLQIPDMIQYSPIFQNISRPNAQITIAYGDLELPELKAQSVNFSQKLLLENIPYSLLNFKDINHYTILNHCFQKYLFTQ